MNGVWKEMVESLKLEDGSWNQSLMSVLFDPSTCENICEIFGID